MKLVLNKLCVNIPDRELLKDISLSMLPGAIFNFCGPNGIGKTSLLKTIAYANAKKGSVLLGDRVKDISDSTYIDLKQSLYDSFTVMQNLELIAKLNQNELALAAAIHVFELQPYISAKYKDLSTGWRRKVLLSTLLLSDSNIWIIDEPFANLDDHSKKRLEEVIVSKASNGGIVILTNQSPLSNPEITNFPLEEKSAA